MTRPDRTANRIAMERTTLLILGASGRLGRMLQLAWRQAAPAGLRCVWQDRHAGGPDRIVWDPLGGAAVTSVLPGRMRC
ncbi:MAG: hypothetical protein JKP98_23000 [Rhodobacteraceae bacterium]|nr:hypothetical protein [Paracoccaceae bacterium]